MHSYLWLVVQVSATSWTVTKSQCLAFFVFPTGMFVYSQVHQDRNNFWDMDDSASCTTSSDLVPPKRTWVVQWPQRGEDRPTKRHSTPLRPLGGLPRPSPSLSPRVTTPAIKGMPLAIPKPKSPPRSLRPKSATEMQIEQPVPKIHQETPTSVKGLVMPTSSPPDICRVSPQWFQTSMQTWTKAKQRYEVWLGQIIRDIKHPSLIYQEFAHQNTYNLVISQLLAQIGPSTLDFYSKGVDTMVVWMQHFEVTWDSLSLQSLVLILTQAKEAAKHDVDGYGTTSQVYAQADKGCSEIYISLWGTGPTRSTTYGSSAVGHKRNANLPAL